MKIKEEIHNTAWYNQLKPYADMIPISSIVAVTGIFSVVLFLVARFSTGFLHDISALCSLFYCSMCAFSLLLLVYQRCK